MQRYIGRRLVQAVIVLLVMSAFVFAASRLLGDPVTMLLPMDAPEEARQQLRHELGLDRPLAAQYFDFVKDLAKGDLGVSVRARRPVAELLRDRLPNSVRLAAFSMLFAIPIALFLGVLSAVNRGKRLDQLSQVVAVLGQSMPAFWVGIVLIEIFSVRLDLLPAAGMGGISNFVLPGITLGLFAVAGLMRLIRSAMLESLEGEYVKLARIKGLSERVVVWKHALKNALVPAIGFVAVFFAVFLTAAITVEVVFAWPGIGRLAYEAITYKDYPLIQGVVLLMIAAVIIVNLIADIMYAYVDPRIRYS